MIYELKFFWRKDKWQSDNISQSIKSKDIKEAEDSHFNKQSQPFIYQVFPEVTTNSWEVKPLQGRIDTLSDSHHYFKDLQLLSKLRANWGKDFFLIVEGQLDHIRVTSASYCLCLFLLPHLFQIKWQENHDSDLPHSGSSETTNFCKVGMSLTFKTGHVDVFENIHIWPVLLGMSYHNGKNITT